VPKNLLEQFQRVANFYFLIIGIVQVCGEFATVTSFLLFCLFVGEKAIFRNVRLAAQFSALLLLVCGCVSVCVPVCVCLQNLFLFMCVWKSKSVLTCINELLEIIRNLVQ
jgi:hypothetical protein